jgi:hypothetical protein
LPGFAVLGHSVAVVVLQLKIQKQTVFKRNERNGRLLFDNQDETVNAGDNMRDDYRLKKGSRHIRTQRVRAYPLPWYLHRLLPKMMAWLRVQPQG